MRLLTKAAVGVGVVLIGAGVWYANSDKSEVATTADQQVADSGQTPAAPTGEQPEQPAAGAPGTTSPIGDTTDARSSREASPAPRSVDTGFGASPSGDRSFRPQVGTTQPPRLTMPTERIGLADAGLGSEPEEKTDSAGSADAIETVTDAAETDTTETSLSPQDEPRTEDDKETAALPVAPIRVAEKPAPTTPTIATITTKPAAAEPQMHTIQSGDTFSSLAVRYYGHAKYASLIAKANADKDPRRLFIGAKINIPPAPEGAKTAAEPAKAADTTPSKTVAAGPIGRTAPSLTGTADRTPAPSAAASGRTYTVQPGEGWYELAQRFLGKGTDWPELYEYNKELVSNNPNMLRAGTTIELPEHAKLPTAQ